MTDIWWWCWWWWARILLINNCIKITKRIANFLGEAFCTVNILETSLQSMAQVIQVAVKARFISVSWNESKALYEVSMSRRNLQQPVTMMVCEESTSTLLLILSLSTRWMWVINCRRRPQYARERGWGGGEGGQQALPALFGAEKNLLSLPEFKPHLVWSAA